MMCSLEREGRVGEGAWEGGKREGIKNEEESRTDGCVH
jgi:hypothetical protein